MRIRQRFEWIDIAKGILAYLVVYGHCCQNTSYYVDVINVIRRIIYSFHMPAFFMLSGYLFDIEESNQSNFRSVVKKKAKRLLFPGICGMIITFIYNITVEDPNVLFYVFSSENIIKQLIWKNDAVLNYWFLGALFSLSLVMFIIHRFFDENKAIWMSLLLLCFGMIYKQKIGLELPFSLIQAFVSAPFFELGIMCQEEKNRKASFKTVLIFFMSCIFLIVSVILNPSKYNCGVWNASIGEMQWYLLCGILGGFMVISISKILSSIDEAFLIRKILATFGRNSLYIYMYSGLYINFFLIKKNIFSDVISGMLDILVLLFAFGVALLISLISYGCDIISKKAMIIFDRL